MTTDLALMSAASQEEAIWMLTVMVCFEVRSFAPHHGINDFSILNTGIVSSNNLKSTSPQAHSVPLSTSAALPLFAAQVAKLEAAVTPAIR
jgi:hypothetical protein